MKSLSSSSRKETFAKLSYINKPYHKQKNSTPNRGMSSLSPFCKVCSLLLLHFLSSFFLEIHHRSCMISAQLLKDPREKSNNKISSGYPHFPITSIPQANNDETELPRIQQLVLYWWNKIVLSFSTLHAVKACFNFPPPEPELHMCCRFHFQKNILRMPTLHTDQVILSISLLNLAFRTGLTATSWWLKKVIMSKVSHKDNMKIQGRISQK